MLNLFRKIPHPTYGNYGGAYKRCRKGKGKCPLPIDWMDKAFREHDLALRKAKSKKGECQADHRLGSKLRRGNAKVLSPYGKIYLFGAKLIFKPKRRKKKWNVVK